MRCCTCQPSLIKRFLLLFVVYGIIVSLGGIFFLYLEAECSHEISNLATDEPPSISELRTRFPSPTICREVGRMLHYRRNTNNTNTTQHGDMVLKLHTLCEKQSADREKVSNTTTECTKWTLDNLITWFFFSSSTIFTIGKYFSIIFIHYHNTDEKQSTWVWFLNI